MSTCTSTCHLTTCSRTSTCRSGTCTCAFGTCYYSYFLIGIFTLYLPVVVILTCINFCDFKFFCKISKYIIGGNTSKMFSSINDRCCSTATDTCCFQMSFIHNTQQLRKSSATNVMLKFRCINDFQANRNQRWLQKRHLGSLRKTAQIKLILKLHGKTVALMQGGKGVLRSIRFQEKGRNEEHSLTVLC